MDERTLAGITRIFVFSSHRVLALVLVTFGATRLNPSARRFIRPLTQVFFAVMGGTAAYEGLKMLAFPHVTLWESHLMTIGVNSVAAVVLAYFVLRRQSRLLDRAVVELRERERAEQALRQSEAGLREALLAAQMGVWEWTVETDTVTWDENVYRIAGLDPKLPAPSFQEQQRIYPPESWEQLKAAVENAVATGSPYEYDLEMVRPDGSKRWVIGRGEPLGDASGNITRFRGTVQDITDRKRAEQELRRVNRALRTISACNQVLERAEEEPSLLKDTCEILVGAGGYRMAWVGFVEHDEAKSIRPVAHAGFEEGYLQRVSCNWADTELGRGATGTAIRTGTPVVGRDFRTDPKLAPWREEALKRRYESNIALPILLNDQVLGALTIYAEEPEAFDLQEVQLLAGLSGDLAYGIQALRTKAEHKLAEAENSRLAVIVNSSDDAIFSVTTDGLIASWNAGAERMYGYAPQEIRGKHFAVLIPANRHGDSAANQERLYRGESLVHHEFERVRKDGSRLQVSETLSPLRDARGLVTGVSVIARDVTEGRRIEQALHESERKYRELVQHANSIILRWNRDGRIIFLNEYGQRFFGYTEAEIAGRHVIGTLVPEIDSSGRNLPSLMEEICANPAAFEQNVNENMRRNGERAWIAWTNKVVLNQQGQAVEILSIGTDITARKQAEEELRAIHASLERRVIERTAELAVARDRAEMADRTKSAFLATMSHELRTPLNSIIGFTGLLLQGLAGPLNAEQAKQLGMVKESGRHLLALINDVLDISKIEAGQIEIANAPFDLPESIQKVVQTVTPLANKKKLPLTSQIAPGVSHITSDRRRVEQILLNLLSNAVKFTERGEVTLTAEITPGTRRIPHPAVRISVADTGIGIKHENLDKLFQPFRQLDTGLTRQHEGTGLGLAISKRLVERLGGTITVESEWGKGSTFHCTLPIHPERKS